MSGLKLFELGNLDITTGGTSLSLGGMNTIGVSEITNGSNSVTINSGASIFLDTNGTERLVIDPFGRVGLGLSNPSARLDVNGTFKLYNINTGSFSEDSTQVQLYAYTETSSDSRLYIRTYNSSYTSGFYTWITTTGSQTALNFTGQHRNLMNTSIGTSQDGLIVSATNKIINLNNSITPSINESLPYCVLSNIDNDKKVFGVISTKEDNNTSREYYAGNFVSAYEKENINEERIYINSLGEGAIWVSNKNGSLEIGDYIVSTSIPGYGGKQTDDLLHNYTVAKITCDCNFNLTKIVKQKLKTIITSEGQELVYDTNGDPEYENDLDPDGNIQMVYQYQTRFLQADGTLLVDQTDYETRLANGESVYIACFVGCTYHCG